MIRPTGLLDPEIEVRPVEGQIDDLIGEVKKEIAGKHKILIATLTGNEWQKIDRLYAGTWYSCPLSAFRILIRWSGQRSCGICVSMF